MARHRRGDDPVLHQFRRHVRLNDFAIFRHLQAVHLGHRELELQFLLGEVVFANGLSGLEELARRVEVRLHRDDAGLGGLQLGFAVGDQLAPFHFQLLLAFLHLQQHLAHFDGVTFFHQTLLHCARHSGAQGDVHKRLGDSGGGGLSLHHRARDTGQQDGEQAAAHLHPAIFIRQIHGFRNNSLTAWNLKLKGL